LGAALVQSESVRKLLLIAQLSAYSTDLLKESQPLLPGRCLLALEVPFDVRDVDADEDVGADCYLSFIRGCVVAVENVPVLQWRQLEPGYLSSLHMGERIPQEVLHGLIVHHKTTVTPAALIDVDELAVVEAVFVAVVCGVRGTNEVACAFFNDDELQRAILCHVDGTKGDDRVQVKELVVRPPPWGWINEFLLHILSSNFSDNLLRCLDLHLCVA